MQVDGSTNNGRSLETIARLQEQSQLHGAKQRTSQKVNVVANTEAATAPSESSADARGVTRLIQEGHFKGVADVRLRINFFDSLQRAGADTSQATLSEGLTNLQSTLNAAIDEKADGGSLSDEDVSTLRAAQSTLNVELGALIGDKSAASGDIFQELKTAFSDFLNALPIEQPKTVSLADIAASTDAPETTGTSGDQSGLRSVLQNIFDPAVAALENAVDALALPPVAAPQNNGRAYDNFLSTYNALYGVEGAGNTATSDGALNAVT